MNFGYLVYIIFWESLVFGGCGYIVFGLNQSPWWFALAVFLGGNAYKPPYYNHTRGGSTDGN